MVRLALISALLFTAAAFVPKKNGYKFHRSFNKNKICQMVCQSGGKYKGGFKTGRSTVKGLWRPDCFKRDNQPCIFPSGNSEPYVKNIRCSGVKCGVEITAAPTKNPTTKYPTPSPTKAPTPAPTIDCSVTCDLHNHAVHGVFVRANHGVVRMNTRESLTHHTCKRKGETDCECSCSGEVGKHAAAPDGIPYDFSDARGYGETKKTTYTADLFAKMSQNTDESFGSQKWAGGSN